MYVPLFGLGRPVFKVCIFVVVISKLDICHKSSKNSTFLLQLFLDCICMCVCIYMCAVMCNMTVM